MFFCFSSSTGADGSEGSNAGGGAGGGGSGIEAIGLMERRTLLTTMCGVISVNFDLSIFYISNCLARHHVFLILFLTPKGTYRPDVYTFSSLSSTHRFAEEECPTNHVG